MEDVERSRSENNPNTQAGGPGATPGQARVIRRTVDFDQQNHENTSRLFNIARPPLVKQLVDLRAAARGSSSFNRYPRASAIDADVPIYDAATLTSAGLFSSDDDQEDKEAQLKGELYDVLLTGPGVFVVKNMYPLSTHSATIDSANAAFKSIIEDEKAKNGAKGDHFAAGGRNDRVWNSFTKHALVDPASFVAYYSNRWLALISEAWLGPAYRVTTQLNVVKPGGAPQVAHRDYHLGFQSADACARYPTAMQVASQLLTLQGAVAHSDMPLASGPTRFLPFSQQLSEGFMAYRLPEFVKYFDENWISLPLEKGDGVFFNPALFHAAGENQTHDVRRSANLIQVSSAFGKPMESIDTVPIVEQCWPYLVAKYDNEGMSGEVMAAIAAIGEGYSFPTNLDRRPPGPGGMAPEDEQTMMRRCLKNHRDGFFVLDALRQIRADSQA